MNKRVEIFPWNGNFETGIREIDEQHKKLVDLLNVLVGCLAFQSAPPELDKIFEDLKDYAQMHFAFEEKIWHRHFKGDFWEELHKHSHGDFVGQIIELRKQESTKPLDEVIESISGFLTHWLALHIIEADKRMAKVVLTLGTGVQLEMAKEIADREMSGATRVLIDTVMGMYDKLAHRTIQMTREITARTKAETELRNTQQELIRLKDEAVTRELRTRKEINNFTEILTHHLQEPVRLQQTFVLKLEKLLAAENVHSAEIDQAMRHVVNGADRLRMLLRDAQTHLSLSQQSHMPKLCDTSKAVIAAQSELAVKIGETKADIQFHSMPTVMVDFDWLVDIFRVLLDNSLTFTRPNIPPVIRILAEVHADEALFVVSDNGIGIAEEYRERVFNIFERLDTHKKSTGTGIGLALVRKSIESANGKVWIEASELGGISVKFTVPLQ